MPSNHRRQFRVHLRIWIKMKLLCSETRILFALVLFTVHIFIWNIEDVCCEYWMNTVFAMIIMIRSNTIIPKSMQDYHLGCFRFGDPSTPVPCFREQTRPGFLALWIRLIIVKIMNQSEEWEQWNGVFEDNHWSVLMNDDVVFLWLLNSMFPHESCFSCCQNGVVFWKSSGICPGEAKNSSSVQYGFRW